MKHSKNAQGARNFVLENQVISNRHATQAAVEFVLRDSKLRMFAKQANYFIQSSHQGVGRLDVIGRDMLPDVQ